MITCEGIAICLLDLPPLEWHEWIWTLVARDDSEPGGSVCQTAQRIVVSVKCLEETLSGSKGLRMNMGTETTNMGDDDQKAVPLTFTDEMFTPGLRRVNLEHKDLLFPDPVFRSVRLSISPVPTIFPAFHLVLLSFQDHVTPKSHGNFVRSCHLPLPSHRRCQTYGTST